MSSGRDEYLSKFSEKETSYTQKKYNDFNEWFKLVLPSLWISRDEPWSNEKLKAWLQEAFDAGRAEMHLKGPQPPCSVTAPVSNGWPAPKERITL